MPTVAGLRGTGDWGADQRPKNFRETILYLDPNGQAPLSALMSKMGSQSTDDPEFSWWEERQDHVRIQVNGAVNNSATTIVVDEYAEKSVAGDLFIVESATGFWTNEIVKVTANPTSDTSLTVQRGFAGTTAGAIADDSYLTKIGTVFAEGTRSPKSVSRNPVKLNNFCQIFKTTYELTNTATKTRTRTGDPIQNDKKRKMFDHMRDMEMAFWYGRKNETTGENGKPERTTAGLLDFITTNRTQFGTGQTTWSEDNLIDFFAQMFNWNGQGAGNERLAFIGNSGLTAINRLARNSASTRINFDGTVKVYGMELTKWVIPQGVIYLRTHPLFNIHPVLTKSMACINPRGIMERTLRSTNFMDNIQENDADTRKGQWLSEVGLEVHHEETMAFATNLGG